MSAATASQGRPDFAIVGGGPAGCVLANRLSAAGADVVLLESGRDVRPGVVPADVADLYPRSYYNPAYSWRGLEADQGCAGSGALSPFTQARVLGGGSSISGMAALRGVPDDYDGWAAVGAAGWDWSSVLPFFRRLESDRDFAGPLHGDAGPVPVRRHAAAEWPPFCAAVGEAAARLGWDLVEDMNADFRDGYGRLPLSADESARASAATAYLDAGCRARANLRIECGATAERLLFEGSRCVGVAFRRGAARHELHARRVVLAAGAIHSPALLMRSGVGPEEHLAGLGLPLVAALPGVGANLQNHPVVYLATHLAPTARQAPGMRPQFNSALRWSSGSPGAGHADMLANVVNKSSWHGLGEAIAGIGVMLMQPRSRGTVRLSAADPSSLPTVRFAMASEPADFERLVDGVRLALRLMRDDAVRELRHELFAAGYSPVVRRLNAPGAANRQLTRLLAAALDGPDWLRHGAIRFGIAGGEPPESRMGEPGWAPAVVRRRGFGTYHVAGTCRIGSPDDEGAVVDPGCSVLGTEGLSVVDASIMPTVPRANTFLPVTMVAERAAELLLTGAAGSGGA